MCQLLTERHGAKTRGTISCLDRVVIIGTLPQFCYAKGMTSDIQLHIAGGTEWGSDDYLDYLGNVIEKCALRKKREAMYWSRWPVSK